MVVMILVISGILIYKTKPEQEITDSSTFNSFRFGSKAFYLFLKESGYQVERLTESFPQNLEMGIMFIIAPSRKRILPSEVETLIKWVKRGNSIVFLSGRGHYKQSVYTSINEEELLKYLNISINSEFNLKSTSLFMQPVVNNFITEGISEIELDYFNNLQLKIGGENSIPLFENDTNCGIYIFKIGRGGGKIMFFPSSYPICNEGIIKSDNFRIFANIISNIDKKDKIYFDDYHHGVFDPTYFLKLKQRRRIGFAFILFLIAFILLIFRSYKRFGRIYPLEKSEAVSVKDYIYSLSNLYQKAKKGKEVLKDYYKFYLVMLCKKFGIRFHKNKEMIFEILKLRKSENYSKIKQLDTEYEHIIKNFNSKDMLKFTKTLERLKNELKF
jgi:hypothetical protein